MAELRHIIEQIEQTGRLPEGGEERFAVFSDTVKCWPHCLMIEVTLARVLPHE